eukprot:scaffold181443_cov33-Tisochrysis_lutea.AAC.1
MARFMCRFVESGPNDLAETIFRLAMVSVRRARTSSKRAMGITGKPSVPEGEMPRLKAKDVSDIYCARLCEEAAGWKQQQTSPRPTARASAEDQGPPIGADGGLPLGSKSVAGVSDVPSISDSRLEHSRALDFDTAEVMPRSALCQAWRFTRIAHTARPPSLSLARSLSIPAVVALLAKPF